MANSKKRIKSKLVAENSIEFPQLTANTVPVLDAEKNIVSSTVTSTELSNLSGTTSPIQEQLDDESERILDVENNSKVLTVYAYENNAQVYADGQPGIQDPSALIRDGWYFKNSVAGQKINWYYFDGLNQGTVTLGQLDSVYAVMTFDSISPPIIAVYTLPTGINDAIPGFAHSRIVYDATMTPSPVVGKQYLVYGGTEPSVHPQLSRIQLAKIPELCIGEQLPTEQIFTVSFGSASGEAVNSVQYMVETLGLFSEPVKHELDLRIRTASSLQLTNHITDFTNPHSVTKSQVGLGNVDNTSDADKPISTATQNALDLKQNNLGFTPENVVNKSTNATMSEDSDTLYPTQKAVKTYVDNSISSASVPDATSEIKGKIKLAGDLSGTADSPTVPELANKEPSITAGTTSQYFRGDKTFQTLDKIAVGLDQVDNTSDADKPISEATQDALDLKYDASNPANYVDAVGAASAAPVQSVAGKIGIVNLTKSDVGLANVDNTSDADKPISTATQSALDLKQDNLGFTPENVANKSSSTSLGTSDILYPTQNAVKSYVDSGLSEKIDSTREGQPNGIATLDSTGKVPSTQLPSYVDDVIEAADFASLPLTGETGKIYVTLDSNICYRWSGSAYVQITSGAVASVNGQTGIVVLTKSDVGLGNVDNTSDADKPISEATQDALDLKQDSLGFTPENIANKSTDTNLGTSDTLYPTQKAVKTYVDSTIGSSSPVLSVNGQTGSVVLNSQDLNHEQAIPAYWDVADNSTIKAHLDELAARREAQNELTKEPTGFATRDESTTSFSDSGPDRTFTIAPLSTSFTFYVKGVKFVKSSSEQLQIPNLSGNHFIYYNASGVLSSTQVADASLFKDNALIAIVYWNAENNIHSYFAEERHGLQMDGETHSYLHTVFGAQYLSGLALQNFTVDGDGSLASQAQFTADEGTIRDEDLLITIPAQSQIPVLYRQGTLWRKKQADAYPMIYSGTAGYTGASGRLAYNQLNAGSWQLTEVANNSFVLIHLFGTNDKETPVIAIQGIAEYGNVTAARLAASSEITSLSGLPFAEFVALGSVVVQTANAFSNIPKAAVVSVNGGNYVDFRGTQLYTPAGVATSHGLLSGLSNDDHIQYHTDARGDARYYTKSQVDSLIGAGASAGDISEKSYSFSNSQIVPESITDFAFSNSVVRGFSALVTVELDADSKLFENFTLNGIQKDGVWDMSIESTGDDSGVSFYINSSGQIKYTSLNKSGFISGLIKFRAITTSV